MKTFTLSFALFLYSGFSMAFVPGAYKGKTNEEKCQIDLRNISQGVTIEYYCVSNNGSIFETSGPQLYPFGSTSNQYEDETGTYLVTTFGDSEKLEYKIVKLSENNSTWLESIQVLADKKIHFSVSLDNQFWIDMDLQAE